MGEAGRAPYTVLFLCTGNSARSIIAETVLNKTGKGRFRAFSAGSHPSGSVNPNAIALLSRLGFDVAGAWSKSWDAFLGPDAPKLDLVITLCDGVANEVCPVWPGRPIRVHWGMPNPASVRGGPEEVAAAFERAFDVLARRLALLVALPVESLDRASLNRRLEAIGQDSVGETARDQGRDTP